MKEQYLEPNYKSISDIEKKYPNMSKIRKEYLIECYEKQIKIKQNEIKNLKERIKFLKN